jgi:hypothetical protein
MVWLLKRWWFWTGTAFMLVAVCAGYLLIPFHESPITEAICNKIERGWTQRQLANFLLDHNMYPVGFGERAAMWLDEDRNVIWVEFDQNNCATRAYYEPTKLSFSERMKRRIERRIGVLWP